MSNFETRPAVFSITAKRKLVYGVGVNDADYVTYPKVNGKRIWCPYYKTWHSLLQRVFSPTFVKQHKTYKGCTVCEEWLTFSKFKKWMEAQKWKGMQLDKDVKIKGNKEYSPATCLFIPQSLNTALNQHQNRNRVLPVGVGRREGKYHAKISIDSKIKYLGAYATKEEAEEAYLSARRAKIEKMVTNNTYPMASHYLLQHI